MAYSPSKSYIRNPKSEIVFMAKIETSEDLKAEIKRLNSRCRQIESQLDDNMDHLRDNYKSMAFNSIIGNRIKGVPILAAAMGLLAGSPLTKRLISFGFEKLMGKRVGFFERWLGRFFRG